MVPYLKTQGLWDTAQGVDRHWKDDETKGAKYEKLAQRLWRTLTRAIMDDTLAGANMKMVMRDDFPDVWNYTGQRMKSTWEKIPPRRRGGGTEYHGGLPGDAERNR